VAAAERRARQIGVSMFMAVVDDCGVIKMSSRMDGNSQASVTVVPPKAVTANAFRTHRHAGPGGPAIRPSSPRSWEPALAWLDRVWTLPRNRPTPRRQAMTEPTLYDRLGGVFAIAAVVDHFSDAVVQNPIVGQKSENPDLREWHTNNLGRLPGLKFMRTLWVCDITGGPQQYVATVPGGTPLGLEEAHRKLKISPAEFDEVAAELARTLDVFKVPEREKGEVLGAFAAHKDEVTQGSTQ
jgi:hemoglobin